MLNGWFTTGTVTFITENERRDGKGSFLSVYVRFGEAKAEVRKAKVWAANYEVQGEGFALKTESGEFAPIEVGTVLTARGTESTYKVEGNERVGHVLTQVEVLEPAAPAKARKVSKA
jgi:hypothetical protein